MRCIKIKFSLKIEKSIIGSPSVRLIDQHIGKHHHKSDLSVYIVRFCIESHSLRSLNRKFNNFILLVVFISVFRTFMAGQFVRFVPTIDRAVAFPPIFDTGRLVAAVKVTLQVAF